jgi:NAD(P)H-hydrate epimerase
MAPVDLQSDRLALLTTEEMSRADRLAVERGTAGITLMENAGRGVAESVCRRWPAGRVAVLCGPGNNGGDGFVAARHLRHAGWEVRLGLVGRRDTLKGDAAHHAAQWDGEVEAMSPELIDGADLAIDALFGAGLGRPLEGSARDVVEALNRCRTPVAAIDVPSGLSGDSGQPAGDTTVKADLTVTFFRKKPGHVLLPGRLLCGEVVVADIGIPDPVLAEIDPRTFENGPALWRAHYPWREPDGHKYRYGHALVLGGATVTGAARLAARAALRIGAGLVTLASAPSALPIYAQSSPSLIMAPLDVDGDFSRLLEDERKNAVLVGPGNGVSEQTRARALAALQAGKSVVIDADALSVFQERTGALFDAIEEPCVLTPHDGEFKRLFPELEGDKLERAREAARKSGAVILLKGGDTVVAAPDGRAAVNSNAPPYLATAGAGDVLGGLVLGLLAQGMPAFEAAAAAVWVHGEAGNDFGPGLIAEDLSDALPGVLRRLGGVLGSPA